MALIDKTSFREQFNMPYGQYRGWDQMNTPMDTTLNAGNVGISMNQNYVPDEVDETVTETVYPNEPFLYSDLNPYRSETEKFRTRFDPTKIEAAPEKRFNFPSMENLWEGTKNMAGKFSPVGIINTLTGRKGATESFGGYPGGEFSRAGLFPNEVSNLQALADQGLLRSGGKDAFGTNVVSMFGDYDKAMEKNLGVFKDTMAKKGFTTLDELEDYYQKYGDKSYILNKLKHVRGWNKQGDKPVDDKIITPTNINTQTGGGHDHNVHGPIDYGRGSDGRQSYDFGQGFGAHATSGGPVSNRTGRGRQDWAQGGRIGFGNGGLTKYEIFKLAELGYNTKGGTDLARFGGEKVLRDILRVNQYAYGGRAGYKDGYSVQDDMTDYAENVGKEANPGGGFNDSDDGGGNPPPSYSTNEPPKNLNFNLVKDVNPAFNYRSNYGKLSGVLDTVRTIEEEKPEGAIGYFSPEGTFGLGFDTNKGFIGTANLGNLNLGVTGTGGPTLDYQGSFGDGSGRFGVNYGKDGLNLGVNYHKTFNNGGIVGLYR